MTAAPAWTRAAWAARLLATDPAGLKGLWLRARAGPLRDRFMQMLGAATAPLLARRIHPGIGDDALYGGIDIAATLATGRPVTTAGLVAAAPSLMILPMAERCPPGLAARLAAMLDDGRGHVLVALDEGAEPDEALPAALAERLAFRLTLDGLALADCPVLDPHALDPAEAGEPVDDPTGTVTELAAAFGIDSLRAPLLTLAAARASASVAGRGTVGTGDLRMAAELVLAPRARSLPATEAEEEENDQPPPDPGESPEESEGQTRPEDIPREILLEAIRAALPPGVLEALASGAGRGAGGQSQAGMKRVGNRRGRPLPSRPGKLSSGQRLDLVATLRAAAPWQPLRRRAQPDRDHLLIRTDDIRLRRHEERSDRVLIFVVDASGSTALARLAEAKGAIETLLAQAYARRDHVALIAFRGTQAELLLPPTRSLVQTKRRLSALPGGGATPLASGLKAALELSARVRGRGMAPGIAVLTDGRANIGLDGQPGRAQAAEDASGLARAVRAGPAPAIVIDTGIRPQPAAKALAEEMGARYLPLPNADARTLSGAVSAALESDG